MRLLVPWHLLLENLFGTRAGQMIELLLLTVFSLGWHGLQLGGEIALLRYAAFSGMFMMAYPLSFGLLARDGSGVAKYAIIITLIAVIPLVVLGGSLLAGLSSAPAIATAALSALVISALSFPLTMYAVISVA